MAISPQLLKANLEKEADHFEGLIDTELCTEKLCGNTVSISPPKGMSYVHYQIVKDRYISAGWTDVKWNDNQHDGTSILFEYSVK